MATNGSDKSMDDFPTEVLVVIFDHLNLTSLLYMSRVCKRFRTIAKETFGRRYSGENDDKFYNLAIHTASLSEEMKRYRPFFRAFGKNMHAIYITNFENNLDKIDEFHWVYDLITKYCTSLRKLTTFWPTSFNTTRILQQLTTITHIHFIETWHSNYQWVNYTYPNLISLKLIGSYDEGFKDHHLKTFLCRNRHLEELCVSPHYQEHKANILDMINGKFNELTTMELYPDPYAEYDMPNLKSTIIKLPQLESVMLIDRYATVTVLQAICKGCPNITKLEYLPKYSEESWNGDATLAVCSLKKLITLAVDANGIKVEHIRSYVKRLSHLSSLWLNNIDESSKIIKYLPQVVPFCERITELEFTNYAWINRRRLCEDFLASITKLRLPNQLRITFNTDARHFSKCYFSDDNKNSQLIITQERIRLANGSVYWDGSDRAQSQSTHNLVNLDDKCLTLIASYLDVHSQAALYNTCIRIQGIVKDHISTHVFHVMNYRGNDIFRTLGDHIFMLKLDFDLNGDQWSNIHQFCATTVTEIEVCKFGYLNQLPKLIWPNVKKLDISDINSHFNYMRAVTCPQLEHLQFANFNLHGLSPVPNQHGHFRHLTTLKFDCFNESVAEFLLSLEQITCQNMKMLSLGKNSIMAWNEDKEAHTIKLHLRVLIVLERFQNLSTLHLVIPRITDLCIETTFGNNSKLVHLEVCFDILDIGYSEYYLDTLKYIKNSCDHIEYLHLIGPPRSAYDLKIISENVKIARKIFPGTKIVAS